MVCSMLQRNQYPNFISDYLNDESHEAIKYYVQDFIKVKAGTNRAKCLRFEIEYNWIQSLRACLRPDMTILRKGPKMLP